MDELSVTATEAILTYLAFCDADYAIDLYECAIEPHVMNHIDFLRHIGADITVHFDHHFTIKPAKIASDYSDYSSFKII
jgi:UDP-N-acetylglucosamine enolpyruvyl transferase